MGHLASDAPAVEASSVKRRMLAYRLIDYGRAELEQVPVPEPGPLEVRLAMAGAGLCRSDLEFLDAPPGTSWFGGTPPFTLGHENAGWIDAIGPGVVGLAVGDAVISDHHVFCGSCSFCRRGYDNYCPDKRGGRGYGLDGGLAEFLVAPAAQVVALGDLDPRTVAPLADAGRTSYHAVKKVAPKLTDDAAAALVIGAGGLGTYAIQWLQLLSSARIIVADVNEARRANAVDHGAHDVIDATGEVVDAVVDLTAGAGVDVVLDFVGSDDTVRTSLQVARSLGAVGIIGAGGGRVLVDAVELPLECDIFQTRGGGFDDLVEVVALSRQHDVRHGTVTFALEDAPRAYELLRAGELDRRAVVAPAPKR